MLHLCTDRRLCVLHFFYRILAAFTQLPYLRWTAVDFVLDFASGFVSDDCVLTFLRAKIAATVNHLFLAREQRCSLRNIMDIGGRCLCRVNQSAVLINPDMRFLARVPCVAFPDLMGVRIPLLLPIPSGRRRENNRGINDRSLSQDQPPFSEQGYDLCKQLLVHPVFHQQIPEAAYGIPVWHLITGINAAAFSPMDRVCCRALLCNSTAVSPQPIPSTGRSVRSEADILFLSVPAPVHRSALSLSFAYPYLCFITSRFIPLVFSAVLP